MDKILHGVRIGVFGAGHLGRALLILGRAIAAVYPAANPEVRALLELIGTRGYPLRREPDMHAFTVLGPCLPAALALWESLGRTVEERDILDVAERFELPDPVGILKWARDVQPRGLPGSALGSYLDQAATAGGVTEAIQQAIRDGESLIDALWSGIHRSRQLGQGAETSAPDIRSSSADRTVVSTNGAPA